MNNDEFFMRIALGEAKKAFNKSEVPIGCVIVRNDKIISRAHNLRERRRDPLCHAEMLAIKKAAKKLKGWRLLNCRLFVTLEPCPMCAGAIINARIDEVVFGASDEKSGCFYSKHDFSKSGFNHTPKVTSGVLADESLKLLKEFFMEKRTRG